MTDLTRLITSLKRRAAQAKEFGHDVLFVKLEDIDALVEALELKEEQRANWFQMAQKLGDDLDAAEKRNAELVEALEKAQKRNGELETYSKTALEFREAARDENRHLKLELEIAEKRIDELES
ncbi:hypothetical protein RFG51_004827, partial [Klebsiella aerogenes]|nr:hypothetical protein [Klebsiella aerogenes]